MIIPIILILLAIATMMTPITISIIITIIIIKRIMKINCSIIIIICNVAYVTLFYLRTVVN